MFKMIAPPIRHDPFVYHMDFAYRPAVKSSFREQVLKDVVVSDLDVTGSQAKSSNPSLWRQGTLVIVMKYPADCGEPAVVRRNLEKLKAVELVEVSSTDLKLFSMR